MFLVVEGLDGSGKSQLARGLADHLSRRGLRPSLLREPGSTLLGERVRSLLLDPAMGALDPWSEALLFSACRAELLQRHVRPALADRRPVVLDRYFFSTLAYQGGGAERPPGPLRELCRLATDGLLPTRAFLLDLPPDVAARRRRGPADRIEARDAAFHGRVRDTFLSLASLPEYAPFFRVLDATKSPADVLADAVREVDSVLAAGSAP